MTKPKYPRQGRPKRKLRVYKQHGLTDTVAYKRWRKMKDRCDSKSSGSYERYGAAGVTDCKRWVDFENFFADMGEPERGKDSLDRIDNSKGYSKENCRWISRRDQSSNRSFCVWVTFHGREILISALAKELGVCRMSLRNHMRKGRSMEEAYARILKWRAVAKKNKEVAA